MNDKTILEERILHKAVLNVPKKPIVFVTDKGMSEACDNDRQKYFLLKKSAE